MTRSGNPDEPACHYTDEPGHFLHTDEPGRLHDEPGRPDKQNFHNNTTTTRQCDFFPPFPPPFSRYYARPGQERPGTTPPSFPLRDEPVRTDVDEPGRPDVDALTSQDDRTSTTRDDRTSTSRDDRRTGPLRSRPGMVTQTLVELGRPTSRASKKHDRRSNRALCR